MSGNDHEVWSVGELDERLERGQRFHLVDVRNRDEFAVSRIEGRGELPATNVPYFEMLEGGGLDDLIDSVEAYAKAELVAKLPRDVPVLTVCAKGDTSEHVAIALSRLGVDVVNLTGGMRAWGNHHRVRVAVQAGGLTIWQVSRPARGCLSYVAASSGRALLVDPLRHAAVYRDLLAQHGLAVEAVIDTHGHADHISGGPGLADELGAPYWLHPYDGIHPIDVLPARIAFRPLQDGTELRFGNSVARALWAPGHTLGSVALLVDGRFLISGDTIFVRSIARPDLGGKADTWAPLHYESLSKLTALPDATVVLPGHFSSRDEADAEGLFAGRLKELRASNEGLRMLAEGREAFLAYILGSLPKFPPEYVDIKRVNAGLAEPDEERRQELELGKNLCALAQAAAPAG